MSTSLATNAKPLEVTPVEFHEMPADRRVRFMVEQYEQLMRAGFLIEGSPIELLDGQLYWKDRRDSGGPDMLVGRRHRMVVTLLSDWLHDVCRGRGCFPMSQQPISLSETNEPEPDSVVVRGDIRDKRRRHPEPSEILLVVEVADSSRELDYGEKLRLYSTCGIERYWVIDLVDNMIRCYERPTALSGYGEHLWLHKGESVSLTLADGTITSTTVDSLIP